jgi:hypothetical protein
MWALGVQMGKSVPIKEQLGTVVAFLILLLVWPFLVLMFLYWVTKYASLSIRLRSRWGKQKRALLFYTESSVWAPYLEAEVIPKIAEHTIVINRSKENWKREYPLEKKAVEFWGDGGNLNPLGLVLGNVIGVKQYAFFEAFQEFKHGKKAKLNAQSQEFVAHVNQVAAPNK